MLNEIQVKLLDKGFWPNRVWMSNNYKWDINTPYLNRYQRKRGKTRKSGRRQDILNKVTGKIKTIWHKL